jgi:hypothetical protein
MKHLKDVLAWVLAALLVFCVVASYLIRDADATRAAAKKLPPGSTTSLIDQRMLQTAQQTAADADTPQQQAFAQEALRLSDHELDQAFASALREASVTSAPASGPLKALGNRITRWKAAISAEQQRIAKLTRETAANSASADRLELAKAQSHPSVRHPSVFRQARGGPAAFTHRIDRGCAVHHACSAAVRGEVAAVRCDCGPFLQARREPAQQS